MTAHAEAFNAQITNLANMAEGSINAGEEEVKRLVAQLDELEGRIKDAIERATGFTLFHSFQTRR